MKLLGFTNSDRARSQDDMKNTSGYYLILYQVLCLSTNKQGSVGQSTAEAKYVAVVNQVASTMQCY